MSIENLNGGDVFYPTAFNKLNQTISATNSLSSATANIVSLSSSVMSLTAGITANKAAFNTAYTPTSYFAGQMYWDAANHTVAIQTGLDTVTLQAGQESFIVGYNKTNATILNGTAVFISGVQGNRPKILPASSSSELTSYVVGITTMDIPQNDEGMVTVFGVVNDLDTSMWTEGDELYLSATGGVLTNVRPPHSHSNMVGTVMYANGTHGKILITPHIGFELDEIHDVCITTPPAQGSVLVYDSISAHWEASTGLSISVTSGSISTSGSIYSLTSQFMYFGDPNVNGSWRFGVSGNNFIHQRRESSVWVTKDTITP